MDPIGASCFSLNVQETAKNILAEQKRDEKFQEIIVSCRSISNYESKKWKTMLPQVIATSIAASFHIVVGISLAYSAILLPKLNAEDSDIKASKSEMSWLASIIVIAVPVGSILGGFIMDRFGRLNTVKIAVIPGVIGWIMIALATNIPMILVGRLLTGLASAFGTSPAIVYITEIARADMRGSLISFAPAYASLGMVLAYLLGYFMDWRTVAWICNVFSIIPMIIVMFIPESPPWLVSRGRIDEASKSLEWLHKYQPQPENKTETLAQMQLNILRKEHEQKLLEASKHNQGFATKAKEFLKPTGYKPLLILIGLFFFQQFSGIYITLFYSVTFFEAVGSKMNPYVASVLIGTVRFAMSIVNTYMLRTFGRRPLVMWSCLGMAACMGVSGLFTYWNKQGSTSLSWIPVGAVLIYVVVSMMGLLSIPWTIMAELFPIQIRGLAHSVVNSLANVIMFLALQSYPMLDETLQSHGVQWFFAVISLLGLLYSYVVLPETHLKSLKEITDYFNYNTIYLGNKKKVIYSRPVSLVGRNKNIVRSSHSQRQSLMEDGNDDVC